MITPGNSLDGFVIISTAAPGIALAFGHGYTPLPPAVDFVDEHTPPPPDFEHDNITLLTVGPSTFTFVDLSDGIDHLVSLKHQSVSLGWLRGDEFIKDLDEKLDQAKKALAANKPLKAHRKLTEFIHELEEQRREQLERQREASKEGREEREKHSEDDKRFLNDNAFFLLKTNAEFISSKLPAAPKDEDEDREPE